MTKQATKPTKPTSRVFVMLGFDEQRKPRGARFVDPNLDLLIKAAEAMDLSLFEVSSAYLLKTAQSLPTGKLLSTGKGLVGNIRQSLYSDLVEDVSVEPLAIPR